MNLWNVIALVCFAVAVLAFGAAALLKDPVEELPPADTDPELDAIDGLGVSSSSERIEPTMHGASWKQAGDEEVDRKEWLASGEVLSRSAPMASSDEDTGDEALAPVVGRDPKARTTDRGPGWDKTGMRDLVSGGMLFLLSGCVLVAARFAAVDMAVALVVAAPVAVASAWLLKRGSRRSHGLRVERKALRRLKLPATWSIQQNLPVRGHGDADVLLESPSGKRYVIEVKAQQRIVVNRGGLFSRPSIKTEDGRHLPRDPLKQVAALASCLNAMPVIWFPDAKVRAITVLKQPPSVIVQGPQRMLLKAIGARSSWLPW